MTDPRYPMTDLRAVCGLQAREGAHNGHLVLGKEGRTREDQPMSDQRPPFPPFDEEAAWKKVLGAEAAWNTRDPDRVAAAYSVDSQWRNRDTFLSGREEIRDFLAAKWARERDYALRKDLWAFRGNRIAVRFQYESLDERGQWWRSYGNENWEFDDAGLMRRREASINDVAIDKEDKRLFGPRADGDTDGIPLR